MLRQTDRQTDRQTEGLFAVPQGRIEWVDIAKAVAIILVIIGHTVKFGSGTRNVIFSFHMPLFFLLSGYTYRLANDRDMFIRRLKKGCKHLILPCLIVSVISIIASWWQGNVHDAASYAFCRHPYAADLPRASS
ncbi:MAG: acyltransferase family protein [Mitsuokella sp.]|uniref:acyltransferase family protein n=1 Tax=Mitsuokella sp. TaxID=2049034 RepID=UPI003F087538